MRPAYVRATALNGWNDRFCEFGVDAAGALAMAGMSGRAAPGSTETIPLASFVRMAEFAGESASNPAMSWFVGEDYDLEELGEIGTAITSAKTLGSALRRLADHFELLQDSSRMRLEAGPDYATISYRVLDPSIWPRYHDALFSLGIIAKIIKLAVPDAMPAIEIAFECARRATGLNLSLSHIAFGCDANSITIPIGLLDAPMPAVPAAFDYKALTNALVSKRRSRSASEQLTRSIFGRLANGEINQDCLASDLGMSSRTMRRRLAEESTSFQHLLDECRMRQAVLEFQARPFASIADIALKLGYAEHSTFTRAFSRWAGTPPQRFRSKLAATAH